jgi:hypothetical protein
MVHSLLTVFLILKENELTQSEEAEMAIKCSL